MPEHFTLYSARYESLPDDEMALLAKDGVDLTIGVNDDGERRFVYRGPGFEVVCTAMAPRKVPGALQGFVGWVRKQCEGEPDSRVQRILERIRSTRLIVGVVITPERDADGKAEQILATLCFGAEALLFFDEAIYDKSAVLLFAPDGSFDETAEIGPVASERVAATVEIPPRAVPPATPAQVARYERALAELRRRDVPTLAYPLYVEDESKVALRTPAEVARRALTLSAVTLRADGGSRDRALALLARNDLETSLSPQERTFLEPAEADTDLAQKLLWRLEGLWVLLWALRVIDALDWPGGMCDVPQLVKLLEGIESDVDFIRRAHLRSAAEILDAAQLTTMVHWAARDAWIHHRSVPEGLDWSLEAAMVPVNRCAAVGVVGERHHALNWLLRFGDADWDDVPTPT
jgi:hypothetical protein